MVASGVSTVVNNVLQGLINKFNLSHLYSYSKKQMWMKLPYFCIIITRNCSHFQVTEHSHCSSVVLKVPLQLMAVLNVIFNYIYSIHKLTTIRQSHSWMVFISNNLWMNGLLGTETLIWCLYYFQLCLYSM